MKLRSILYVSSSTIAADLVETTVKRIVAEAVACNLPLEVTGALLFTGEKFAQIMEGPSESLAILLERLVHDQHHRDIIVLEDVPIAKRRFGNWAMAYAGPSAFVARTVDRAVADAASGSPIAVQSLVNLMREFAAYS
jgi:hypothetical protein